MLDDDRLELVMNYSRPARPLAIASSGIVWAQFHDKDTALGVFYDILLGRLDPMTDEVKEMKNQRWYHNCVWLSISRSLKTRYHGSVARANGNAGCLVASNEVNARYRPGAYP